MKYKFFIEAFNANHKLLIKKEAEFNLEKFGAEIWIDGDMWNKLSLVRISIIDNETGHLFVGRMNYVDTSVFWADDYDDVALFHPVSIVGIKEYSEDSKSDSPHKGLIFNKDL